MTALTSMQAAFDHRHRNYIPRGELWINKEVYARPEQDRKSSLQAYMGLCREAGMDFLSLPVEMPAATQLPYNRFNLDEIETAVATSGLFTCAVVDGPFQQRVNKEGLMSVLGCLTEKTSVSSLEAEAVIVEKLVAALIEKGVNAVVIADDIAYQHSTYASPQMFQKLLFVYYRQLVELIHQKNAFALFHSDGNITSVIQNLIDLGFDGLAGCEPESLDLTALKKTYGEQLTFITGIRADLLNASPTPPPEQKKAFLQEVQALGKNGGFILCSAGGVHTPETMERLKTLYAWMDEAGSNE